MACDFCTSIATDIVGRLVDDYLVQPVERHLRYLFCFDNFVEELEKQENNLKSTKTRVQRKVAEAKLQIRTQEIEDDVRAWLTNTENVLKDVQSLKDRIEENERCFHCACNWSWRSYQLSKKMEEKTQAMSELVDISSKFETVGHRASLPGIEFFKSEGYLPSKSSISAVNEIMEALMDDEVHMIGVWGIGGVGKTTFVKEVGNKIKEIQLFKDVIEVVVSQTQIIENIQDKIADFLHLTFEKRTKRGKAEELWLRLNQEEDQVLIILDDMWNELNLKEIGIPLVENGKGCKIILTTRDRRLCNHMKCQVTVSLDVLDEDEAWTLFKMNTSLDNGSSDIIDMAKKVAKECGGLPIAIVTLAKALRSKDLKGWELAHRYLERSRLMDIEEYVQDEPDKNVYLSLKTSYDHLKSKATRRCLLLCALYPKDYLIDVEDLVRYAWGLRLYQTADSIQEVRSKVFEAINNLKDCCLLLEDDEKRHIKMHYMVRAVALWIASDEDNCLVKKPGYESENENWKQKLEILLLHNYDNKTSAACFEGMQGLKVLSLKKASNSNNGLFSFNALKSLTKLRVLLLDGFKQLEGISDLAKLSKLEILSLHDSELQKSVDKLGKLENLRVFDFCECKFLLGFPPNLVGKLVKVEELHLYDPTKKATISTASLSQLNCFPNLASLSLELTSLDFPKGYVLPRLERYRIAINTGWLEDPDAIISSRSLRISQGLPLDVISELLWNVEFLGVSKIMEKDIKCLTDTSPGNVVPAAMTLQNLEHVKISDSENLQVIFQIKKAENEAVLLSKLKVLFLVELPAMECIWKIPVQHVSLQSLEKMVLRWCGKLKSLFSFPLAQSLGCLKELLIANCGELEQIVEELEGGEPEADMNLDKSLCFPKLSNLLIDSCKSLEYIFPNFMAPQGLPQLQQLSLKHLPQLKQIRKPAKQRVENDILQLPQIVSVTLEGIQLSNLKEALFINIKSLVLKEIRVHNLIPEAAPLGLNELAFLKLYECKSLEYVVDTTKEHMPKTTFSNLVELHMEALDGLKNLWNGQFPNGFLPNLKRLKVERCSKLKQVLQIDESKENQPQVLPNLEHLELRKLPELRWISKGSAHYFSLQSLKVVIIFSCMKLKYLFSPSIVESLRQLQELKVEDCDELEILFAELECDGEAESNSHFDPLCLPELKTIDVEKCPRLKYVLPVTFAQGMPQLELVRVWNCPQLKHIFSMAKEHDGDGEDCIELPRLKALRLLNLIHLSSFGPENYFIRASALEDLSVDECPQLMSFSIQQEVNSRVELKGEVRLSAFKEFLRNTTDLTLKRIKNQENLFSDVDLERLTSLKLEGCKDLEYLIDTTKEQVPTSGIFSNLEELVMEEMMGLKKLCNGQPPKGFLQNLKMLHVHNCREIVSLYPIAQNLQKLYVYECDELEEVFRIDRLLYNSSWEENQALLLSNLEYLELNSVGKLRSILKGPTQYVNLRSLKVVKIEKCNGLEYLFSFSLIPSLTLLEQLCISYCNRLETVFAKLESDDEPELETPSLVSLKTLEITYCKTLKYILPLSLVEGFRLRKLRLYIEAPALQHLKVTYCSKLSNFTIHQDQLIQSKDLVIGVKPRETCQLSDSTTLIQLPSGSKSVSSLEKLILNDLDWLQYIWKCPTQAVATNLRELEVYACYNLTYIFPLILVPSLLKLRALRILSCIRMEHIIVNDDISASSSSSSQGREDDETVLKNDKEKLVVFHELQELCLEGLRKLKGVCPEGYHLVFPSLQSLEIESCNWTRTSFTVDSTSSVHIKTESSRPAYAGSSEIIHWERDEPTSSLPPYVE